MRNKYFLFGNKMECMRLPKFVSYIDGNMSKAFDIVTNHQNSSGFTLREWEGQEKFYLSCVEQFNDYKTIFMNEMRGNGKDIETLFDIKYSEYYLKRQDAKLTLINLENVIELLIERKELNYAMMLRVYMELVLFIDLARYKPEFLENGEEYGFEMPRYFYEQFGDNSINGIIKGLNEFYLENPKLVPLVSTSGYYGYNTFLYLYYNDLHPIGTTYNLMTAHGGRYPSIIESIQHDFEHTEGLTRNEEAYNVIDGVYPFEYAYRQIFERYDEIGSDKAKMFIFYIFIVIHEDRRSFSDPLIVISGGIACDIWTILDQSENYSPEIFGVDLGERIDGKHDCVKLIEKYDLYSYITDSLRKSDMGKYIIFAMTKIKKDFIEFFGDRVY
jgi:hypothetical protein